MSDNNNNNTNNSSTQPVTRFSEIAQKYGDPWIWGIYFMLVIISIIESYSASSREIATQGVYMPLIKQVIFLAVGAVCVAVLVRTDYNKPRFLFTMIPGLTLLTVFCLIYVMFFGREINGAQRAMQILPGVTLQPAELAKLSIVMLLSYILAKSQLPRDVSNAGMVASAAAVALFGGLMIKSGLTNTLILMCVSLSMLLIGGAKLKKIIYMILAYAVIGGLFFLVKSSNDSKEENLRAGEAELRVESVQQGQPSDQIVLDNVEEKKEDKKFLSRSGTWQSRIHEWWYSDSLVYRDLTDKNQQEMFSRMAQAHGGLFGVGLGGSRECSRLPLAFSDYIFSIIMEEMGLAGGLLVLLLYLWLLARAAMIVRRCKRVLPSLLIIGMASLITFQALFHMAINVGVFPVSGQPLPLISKGGTAIVVMSVAFGVMLSVSRTIANYNNGNNRANNVSLPEGLDAENPTQIVPKNVWK